MDIISVMFIQIGDHKVFDLLQFFRDHPLLFHPLVFVFPLKVLLIAHSLQLFQSVRDFQVPLLRVSVIRSLRPVQHTGIFFIFIPRLKDGTAVCLCIERENIILYILPQHCSVSAGQFIILIQIRVIRNIRIFR